MLAKLGKLVIEHLQSSGGAIHQFQNSEGAVQDPWAHPQHVCKKLKQSFRSFQILNFLSFSDVLLGPTRAYTNCSLRCACVCACVCVCVCVCGLTGTYTNCSICPNIARLLNLAPSLAPSLPSFLHHFLSLPPSASSLSSPPPLSLGMWKIIFQEELDK